MINYEKDIMRKCELIEKHGFPRELLDRAYRAPGQRFAQKTNPAKRNSPIVYDTEEFEKWRQKDIEMQSRALQKQGGRA